ncbi:MAG: flagellar biosynthesis protein FlgA [Zetaproteobacteria bacterium]|nr:MAG: flagellar biosynthesis protein FlgA [Zetaproteobacteria bacterium]
MNLHRKLLRRAEEKRPIRVGVIGAGKFGTMFLAQARLTPGIQILGVADLNVGRAREAFQRAGWPAEQVAAASLAEALKSGGTHIMDDAMALIKAGGLDVVVEATGIPQAGIKHALAAIAHRRHVVMVCVEADALAGPLLAKRAEEAGVVYSLAYGDQPAIICEMVDWARTCGFPVVCAGKGTRYHPTFHRSTPETVWQYFGWSEETATKAGANPKMFNSFIDGTKSGIEMTAVCNATGLTPPPDGLQFPPVPAAEIARFLKPKADGGMLSHSGTVEVISSLNRDMTPVPHHLQVGVYVTYAAPTEYAQRCFNEYWMLPDETGKYAGLYRPLHLIGLELGVSVASAVLRGEPTGCPTGWRADVVATAKRDLKAGEVLDGEGGYMVWGKIVPSTTSLATRGLPLGLAHMKLVRPVSEGRSVTWNDVEVDPKDPTVAFRREMEKVFAPAAPA